MNVQLKDAVGTTILNKDIGNPGSFPDAILYQDAYYRILRVLPGKTQAVYQETTPMLIEEEEATSG